LLYFFGVEMKISFYYVDEKYIHYLKETEINARGFTCIANMEYEYSCAMKSHFRKTGNQQSGSGNHRFCYASLLA